MFHLNREKRARIFLNHPSAVHRRSVRNSAKSRGTMKDKKKPVISITVNAPLMSDLHKRSAPSKNISTMLPYRYAEDEKSGGRLNVSL